MTGRIINVFMLYQFLRRLTTPFKDWDAYKHGIIDVNGGVLRKRRTLNTEEEKSSWRLFDTLVANLKKLIEKIPGGKYRIASFAAALLLLKEYNNAGSVDQGLLMEDVYSMMGKIENDKKLVKLFEDAPANMVGSGEPIGLVDNDPPVKIKCKKKCEDCSCEMKDPFLNMMVRR